MLSANELKARIDCIDLAERLGLKRPGNKGNFMGPDDKKTPSLSVSKDGQYWQDWSNDEKGSCIDLTMYVLNMDFPQACKELHDIYGFDYKPAAQKQSNEPKSLAEYIALNAKGNDDKVIDYLAGRGIDVAIIKKGIQKGVLGYNTWCSDKTAKGSVGYGGEGVAFMVKNDLNKIVAVDTRYLNPEQNGKVKTNSQGEKTGVYWTADHYSLKNAHTLYVVESAINALSIDSCNMPGVASVATRGTQTIKGIDWRFCQGKKVIAVFDNDEPNDKGHKPGSAAAWALHEILTELNISCHLIDQETWHESNYNDVNDIIQSEAREGLRIHLKKIEPWIIPGLPGRTDDQSGKPRIYLPGHDYAQYWRYRAKEDFVTYIKFKKTDEDGEEKEEFQDICGFRIADITRVNIQSATATMTGEKDLQPKTLFSVSVQTPRHGNKLVRKVFEDERLHNIDHWKKFGPVYAPSQFARMVNILERSAAHGARDAVNFVGIAYKQGKLVLNEGPDCYFSDPAKQCPYSDLKFPSGTKYDAKNVITAYQSTFKQNAACMLLVWSLGCHLKNIIGTWPHAILQSSKGSGKSTLIKRLERTIGFTMFSGQSLQTEFRLLTSISATSHPVGWEELSARRQDIIDKAVSMLQESYQYGVTFRGSDMTQYLQCAPVILAGEDVPVKQLQGKVIRVDIGGKMGDILPAKLAVFPVRQWLQFIVDQKPDYIIAIHNKSRDWCQKKCRSSSEDNGSKRMVENYAGLSTSWALLCEFSGVLPTQGHFLNDLMTEMNEHISQTSTDREPWIWILQDIFGEISCGNFRFPYKITIYEENNQSIDCLIIRTTHIMQHLSHSPGLRDTWNAMTIKTDRVLKQQLFAANVVYLDRVDCTINNKRESHMIALDLNKLEQYALHISKPKDIAIVEPEYFPPSQKPIAL